MKEYIVQSVWVTTPMTTVQQTLVEGHAVDTSMKTKITNTQTRWSCICIPSRANKKERSDLCYLKKKNQSEAIPTIRVHSLLILLTLKTLHSVQAQLTKEPWNLRVKSKSFRQMTGTANSIRRLSLLNGNRRRSSLFKLLNQRFN